MNVKKQVLIPLGLAGMVIVIAVPAVLLFRGISEFSAAYQDLNRSVQELRSLYAKEPFPSAANIEQEQENVRAVRQWFERLVAELHAGQIEEEASTPTGFITQYGYTRNNLLRLARARSRQLVAADFAFGFDRYADGALPAPVDVARLMQQLRVIEQVSMALIEAGVRQIVAVKRDEFEAASRTEAGVDVDPRAMPRRRPAAPRAAPDRAGPRADRSDRGPATGSYDTQRFTVEIRAMENTLLDVLNRLARHDLFIVVTGVEFRKTGPDLRMPKTEEPQAAAAIVQPASAPRPAEDDIHSPQNRKVSGPEFESPLAATIDFDVYTFRAEAGE